MFFDFYFVVVVIWEIFYVYIQVILEFFFFIDDIFELVFDLDYCFLVDDNDIWDGGKYCCECFFLYEFMIGKC